MLIDLVLIFDKTKHKIINPRKNADSSAINILLHMKQRYYKL